MAETTALLLRFAATTLALASSPALGITTARTGSPQRLLPPWAPTYSMRQSTFIEPCSSTAEPFNASFGAEYGIISYDWSGERLAASVLSSLHHTYTSSA